MDRKTLSALGIGWASAAIAMAATYAIVMPEVMKIVVIATVGIGVTLFVLNKE